MHELVWSHWEREHGEVVLAPLPADSGTVTLGCFRARGGADPIWVAKIARTREGCSRLRRERTALERLAPWADRIHMPRLLAWHDEPERCCLIQSGLGGGIPWWHISSRGFGFRGRALVGAIAGWLEQFQQHVPSPRAITVQEFASEWLGRYRGEFEAWVPAGLPAALASACRDASAPLPAVAVHGDLWFGNILWRDGVTGITDWCGFDAGSPLDDLLLLLSKSPLWRQDRPLLFRAMFFSPTPLAREVRGLVQRFAPMTAWRLCFYSFLVCRLWWEAGFSYQSRNPQERADSRREWEAPLAWLAAHGFPAPWPDLD